MARIYDFGDENVNRWYDDVLITSVISKDYVQGSLTGLLLTGKRFGDELKSVEEKGEDTKFYEGRVNELYKETERDLNRITVLSDSFKAEILQMLYFVLHPKKIVTT